MNNQETRLPPYPCRRVEIKEARPQDLASIRRLYLEINSPRARSIDVREYFVALAEGTIVGCAAVHCIPDGGYLYGRAVLKVWRKKGIGTALVEHRLQWLENIRARTAVGLVMFWNISAFRKLGFQTVPRADLPGDYLTIPDFRDERNRHCATVSINF